MTYTDSDWLTCDSCGETKQSRNIRGVHVGAGICQTKCVCGRIDSYGPADMCERCDWPVSLCSCTPGAKLSECANQLIAVGQKLAAKRSNV